MTRSVLQLVFLACVPLALSAQNWEVGASAGYGFSRDVSLTNGALDAKTGLGPGFAFGGLVGQQITRHIGGEVRYTFQNDLLRVSSGAASASASAQSHAIHYDFLIGASPSEGVRPFLAIGAGMKYYRGTGAEPVYQPLSDVVVLTHTNEAQPLISAGTGVKFAVGRRTLLRFDIRDYMTPFPGSVLARRAGSTGGGWVHNFVFMVGISGLF